MKRPLYYLLCAIACTSMVSATMPMAAIAEATQPQATAEQQAQADATGSDTGKAEDGTNANVTAGSAEDSAATSTGTSQADPADANATDTSTPGTTAATTTPTPSLLAQTTPTPAAISTTSQTGYAHSATATQNGVTFTVSWNDAPAGTATTFHVTQTNGSSQAKARMDVPTYWDGGSQESVCDPSRPAWASYYSLGTAGHDFTFDFTASGTYRIHFYFMDNDRNDPQNDKGIYYLRTTAEVTVNDAARPSVTQIVNNAVDLCRQETNGSEYDMALWLHDWTLDQLEYDHNLNWCSAESGLTRHQGTCESYQRIYSKLLNAAGIANGRITGNGHTWNAVKIDGKWCQMDLTWDDTSDNWYGDLDQRHLYFGLTDELMAIAHSDHTANYQKDGYAYRSTDLSNNYFARNGKADEWAEKYAERIQQHLDAKEENFSIDADNQSFPPSISGIQNGIVAYAMNLREWTSADEKCGLVAMSNVASLSSNKWTVSYSFEAKYPKGSNSIAAVALASDLDDAGYSTFTCSVTGSNTDIAYQWQWSGDKGATWIDSGANHQTSSTRCAYAKHKEALLFRCAVSAKNSPISYSNAIRIPTLTIPSASITTSEINPGGTAQFKCTVANCSKKRVTYQWQWSNNGGVSWIESGAAYRDAIASVTHTRAKNGLFFRCAITVNGSRFYSNPLTFEIKNTLTASAYATLKNQSTTNQLRCSATGTTSISYQWQWSGDGGTSWIDSGNSYRSDIVTVEYAPRKDSFLFRCRVSDADNRSFYTNAVRLIH